MRERVVEALLARRVRELGGRAVKLVPVDAGLPDRLVLLPGGRSYLVELKAPGGRLRPIQKVWHERAAAIGHHVVVLRSTEDVEQWIEEVK